MAVSGPMGGKGHPGSFGGTALGLNGQPLTGGASPSAAPSFMTQAPTYTPVDPQSYFHPDTVANRNNFPDALAAMSAKPMAKGGHVKPIGLGGGHLLRNLLALPLMVGA